MNLAIKKYLLSLVEPEKPFDRRSAWEYILKNIDADGYLDHSTRSLADTFGWSRTKLNKFLSDQEKKDLIRTKQDHLKNHQESHRIRVITLRYEQSPTTSKTTSKTTSTEKKIDPKLVIQTDVIPEPNWTELIAHYKKATNNQTSHRKITEDTKKLFRQMFKREAITLKDVKTAMTNAAKDSFHQKTNYRSMKPSYFTNAENVLNWQDAPKQVFNSQAHKYTR